MGIGELWKKNRTNFCKIVIYTNICKMCNKQIKSATTRCNIFHTTRLIGDQFAGSPHKTSQRSEHFVSECAHQLLGRDNPSEWLIQSRLLLLTWLARKNHLGLLTCKRENCRPAKEKDNCLSSHSQIKKVKGKFSPNLTSESR